MHARCRKSLIWIVPLLVMGIAGWGGARRAEAKASEDLDLSWLQDDSCAADMTVAELDAPAWEADAMSAPATDAKPGGCRANGQCKDRKQYCAKAVGDCKGTGECKPRPEVCPLIFKPVCGCNNKTYSNECFAAMAGVNVKAEGACKMPPNNTENTCKTNKDCKTAGDFCAKDTGKCEDAGVCAAKPQICPTIVAPVCGCDNKTYNNNCEAHRAGVNVKHDGKCEK